MDIAEILAAGGGAASREQLVGALGRHPFDNAVRRGAIVAVFPRVYAWPWDADLAEIQRRAALVSVGGQAALSQLTTLAARELPGVPDSASIHVTAYAPRHPRGVVERLVVHRTRIPLKPCSYDGLPHVELERALVESWPLLAGPDQRAPIIEAARRRLISAARLHCAAADGWWVPGIRDARELITMVLAGCESPLELWGYSEVFTVPGLDDAIRQKVVHVRDETFRLDMAYEAEMLNVELDGRRYHASPEQWRRDIRRDLLLATQGWQTIRLPHARLFGDVDGCRRDVLEIRMARRRMLA